MKVLIVEDEDVLRRLFEGILTRRGHRALSFASGEEAIRHLLVSGETYDLILTDFSMGGGINGFQFLELVKHNSLAEGARLVVMSGDPPPSTSQRCMELGADFFTKPIEIQDFLREFCPAT
ncbi:MAG: response regulator [Nitrospira sp.]